MIIEANTLSLIQNCDQGKAVEVVGTMLKHLYEPVSGYSVTVCVCVFVCYTYAAS